MFVILDASTYDLLHARLLSAGDLQAFAQHTAWVNGYRVTVAQVLGRPGAHDVGAMLQTAYDCIP